MFLLSGLKYIPKTLCEPSVYQSVATRRILVSNLEPQVDSDKLRAVCEKYGPVVVSRKLPSKLSHDFHQIMSVEPTAKYITIMFTSALMQDKYVVSIKDNSVISVHGYCLE